MYSCSDNSSISHVNCKENESVQFGVFWNLNNSFTFWTHQPDNERFSFLGMSYDWAVGAKELCEWVPWVINYHFVLHLNIFLKDENLELQIKIAGNFIFLWPTQLAHILNTRRSLEHIFSEQTLVAVEHYSLFFITVQKYPHNFYSTWKITIQMGAGKFSIKY